MRNILLTTACTFLVTAVCSRAHNPTKPDEECNVQAWVRAEDLSPDHISHGELRIKVKQAHCANRIASVALRLQLDEFGEVKHLRQGAVIPEIHISHNQTVPTDFLGFWGGSSTDIVHDYSTYDAAMSDSALWMIKAEERRAWSTEAILFENNPNFSQPLVTPFIVASPAVNYPPSSKSYRTIDSSITPVRRHAYGGLGYHYIAVVEFTNGTIIDLPAGHTSFVPTSLPPPPQTPFTWNVTLTEDKGCERDLPWYKNQSATKQRCLPEESRSVFVAEVTLEEGNTISKGQLLKGKVTVHATSGSTTMSHISVSFITSSKYHWAIEQATSAGDENFRNLLCGRARTFGALSVDSVDSGHYPYLFKEKDDDSVFRSPNQHPSSSGPLTVTKPYFDFKLQVPDTAVPDFSSYYSLGEASLELQLSVLYSQDADICINGVNKYTNGEDEKTLDDAAKTEEGLWDSYTRVGQAPTSWWVRSLSLTGQVPIIVLGDISPRPVEHYLKPGLPSPVILASPGDIVFPVAHPATIVEPIANTSARLMREGTFDPYQSELHFWNRTWRSSSSNAPDPVRHYKTGNYAGLLWKKKQVAEERGILPSQLTAVPQDENNGQYHFGVSD
ncbi:hypothetical protein C8R44DRAFT_794024 [Mycena epipterygia]|nr:hypothetical protein C8R44DRAFT_794024 [Mycena epipterygia]